MAEKPKDERDSEDEMQAPIVTSGALKNVDISYSSVIIADGAVTINDPASQVHVGGNTNARQGEGFEEKHMRLCNEVNRHTMTSVRSKVTENFGRRLLNEPNFNVYPEMIRVRDFFNGGYGMYGEAKRGHRYSHKSFHSIHNSKDGELITMDDLMSSLMEGQKLQCHEKNPVTAIVASIGSGKTTLLRRLATDTLHRCHIFEYEGKGTVEQSKYKMVYYERLRNMKHENNLKPSQLLFGGLYRDTNDEDQAYHWVLDHQTEAIFFFDGLDEAAWSIDELSQKEMNPYERGSTSQIMYNLLSGRLLPHVKIVITSREFKVAELPVKARPDEIVSLIGLRREDARKLFMALVGDKGEETWTQISKLSPSLLNILSVPVFLALTAAVVLIDPSSPLPTTITSLYNQIFLSLRIVENVQDRGNFMKVIQRLKCLAHRGMMEGRIVFHSDDLHESELSVCDVRDLLVKVPGNDVLSLLVERDYIFSFCHESFREFLSASFVAGMCLQDFCHFNKEYLHSPRLATVRLFVSGIIYEEHENRLHKVPDRMEKQIIFQRGILSMIEAGAHHNGADLLATIYESNCDRFIQSLPWLPSLSMTKLSPADAHMLASIWARRRWVKENAIRLMGCEIDNSVLDIMVACLRYQRVKVGLLDLSGNRFTIKALNSLIQHVEADRIVINELEDLQDLDWVNIREVEVESGLRMTNEDGRITFEGDVCASFTFEQTSSEISTMTIDCRSNAHLDSSFGLVRKFKVKFLDMHVDDETPFSHSILAEIRQATGTVVTAHWWVDVDGNLDVHNLSEKVNQNQVENLHLRVDSNSSLEQVLGIVSNCKVKTITLVCWGGDLDCEMKQKAIIKHAEPHSIEVEVISFSTCSTEGEPFEAKVEAVLKENESVEAKVEAIPICLEEDSDDGLSAAELDSVILSSSREAPSQHLTNSSQQFQRVEDDSTGISEVEQNSARATPSSTSNESCDNSRGKSLKSIHSAKDLRKPDGSCTVNNQIFFNEDLLLIYCLFWIGDEDHSKKIEYNSKSCPLKVAADEKHAIHFSFVTIEEETDHNRQNYQINIKDSFKLDYFCANFCNFKFSSYVVRPGPDKVQNKYIDAVYRVQAESMKSQDIELRFRNLNRHDHIGQICSDCQKELRQETPPSDQSRSVNIQLGDLTITGKNVVTGGEHTSTNTNNDDSMLVRQER